ncbi:unnamed protein product [Cylicocyclus nassatus]|uniref:Uncharacterized protein n=1 Tax=Cylicocyclus nassatus TaxID=53992 RepID=A0AA36DPE1_CYLNA|nr:unnamed protein product [Cylicocyclus nassatus]
MTRLLGIRKFFTYPKFITVGIASDRMYTAAALHGRTMIYILLDPPDYIYALDVRKAQYLVAEIVVSGGRLSKTTEGTTYLNEGEIPAHITLSLNEAIKAFTDEIVITARDVNCYVNSYMKKYFGDGGRWNVLQAANVNEEQA